MNPVLVDSNIILDVATRDPVWAERSGLALAREAERSQLVINPIISVPMRRWVATGC